MFSTKSITFVIKTLVKKEKYFHHCLCSTNVDPKASVGENKIFDKLIYNEVLWKLKTSKKKKQYCADEEEMRSLEPFCLKYLRETHDKPRETYNEFENKGSPLESTHLPYQVTKKFLIENSDPDIPEVVANLTPGDNIKISIRDLNLEINREKTFKVDNDIATVIRYGTSNPNIPISNVNCGGCGAFLHCMDTGIPGFLPQELFKELRSEHLRSYFCQRCFYLKEFNVALGVNVSPHEYPKIIQQIKNKEALVLLLIDLLDFPCSIWPKIMDIIDHKPVVIVGNKIDLLIQEDISFKKHIKESLLKSLQDKGVDMKNILHVQLISGKTGYGIEELISAIAYKWKNKGDIYLIGCTNAGKSTLFNSLIKSDLCRIEAFGVINRATVSSWPGTTLNLLKFPVKKIAKNLLAERIYRLKRETKEITMGNKIFNSRRNPKLDQAPLERNLRRTENYVGATDCIYINNSPRIEDEYVRKGLDPLDPLYKESKWCFDTPGVVNEDQIINILTTSELMMVIPKELLLPRNFKLQPGFSLFVGGLGRIDYIGGASWAWFTVYASKQLPVTITKTEDADWVYEALLGTHFFRVPCGGKERLLKWPKMMSKELEIYGKSKNEATADVVLSSAGWVSVTLLPAHRCTVRLWTPEGKGIYLRKPPLIKTGFLLRGNRIHGTPAYKVAVRQVEMQSFLYDLNHIRSKAVKNKL